MGGPDRLVGHIEAAVAATERTGSSTIAALGSMGHRENLREGTVKEQACLEVQEASGGDAPKDVRTRVMHYRHGSW
jgi:hypothetical protein